MVNFLNAPFVQLICLGLVKMNAKEKKAFVARMKKARAAAKKNGGGKKKNSKRTKLEKRLADIELKLDTLIPYSKRQHGYHQLVRDYQIERKETKKELEAGDW